MRGSLRPHRNPLRRLDCSSLTPSSRDIRHAGSPKGRSSLPGRGDGPAVARWDCWARPSRSGIEGTVWFGGVSELARERRPWDDSATPDRRTHPVCVRPPRPGLPTPWTAQLDWSESRSRRARRGAALGGREHRAQTATMRARVTRSGHARSPANPASRLGGRRSARASPVGSCSSGHRLANLDPGQPTGRN